jgi:hypothetical protein
MKTLVAKLLRSRLVQAGGLLAAIAAVAASIAWSDHPDGRVNRVKLGGTWVGKLGDITWNSTYCPDSSGQNAAVTLQWTTVTAEFEALFGTLGADSMSLAFGDASMVRHDKSATKLIWYILTAGTASATHPVAGQIKAIGVMESEWQFTSATTALGKAELKLYAPDPQAPMVPNEAYRFFDQIYENIPHVKIF